MSLTNAGAATKMGLRGGRSSWSGTTATVFGGTGFLGRYVVSRLGAAGCRVIVPYRGDEHTIRHLKPMADLGQMNLFRMSIRNVDDIEEAVAGINLVINLLGNGKQAETRRWSFQDVNSSFPSALAEVCAEQGVERFIHVSSVAASVDSPSAWARSKAVGEIGVSEAFPTATIMRATTLFGPEDRFLNRIAKLSRHLPFYPLLQGGKGKQQPVFVDDVAKAIFAAAGDPDTEAMTYQLGGPKTMTFKEITDFVYDQIGDPPRAVSVPDSIGMLTAFGVEQLPNPWLTCDELRYQTADVVCEPGAPGLAEFGIKPKVMEEHAPLYLLMYKKGSPFVSEGVYVKAPQ